MDSSQEIIFNEQSFYGHVALPPLEKGPGILMFHAWWGLTPFFISACQNLADEGFTVLALDLYEGATAHTIDDAKILRNQVDRKRSKKLVRTAIDYLASLDAVSGNDIGAIGFSYGCGYALEAARLRPKIVNAVSLFYGTGGGKFDKTQAAFQGHFAENDEWGADPNKALRLKKRILDANRLVNFYIYPNTTHWFFEKNNDAFDDSSSQLAWTRTIHFLQEHLIR